MEREEIAEESGRKRDSGNSGNKRDIRRIRFQFNVRFGECV